MQNLKTHWRPMAGVLVGLVLCGVFWMRGGLRETIAVQPAGPVYTTVTEAERQSVVRLMDTIDLDRDALVALNLNAADAESLVSTVRTWRADNAGALDTLERTIHLKVAAVRDLKKAARQGPFVAGRSAALAAAQQELMDARAARQAAFAPLDAQVNAILSASQQATWSALRDGFDHVMPLRMLALSSEQKRTLAREERYYRLRMAAARTPEARATAITTRQTVRDQTLTQSQRQQVSDYQNARADASRVAAGAIDTVLPLAGG